jgi:DNA-binding LacI/PurR family transcriptional regulator/DNA-binding FadR family transcriptional regulator
MTKKTPGIKKALEFLNQVLCERSGSTDVRLPTLRQLAAAADVSPLTMSKAIRRLKADGALVTRPRGWMEVARPAAQPSTSAPQPAPAHVIRRKERWRELHDDLVREILNGSHAPGTALPSPKVLMSRYGAGRFALRKALVLLADSGVIVRYGKGYRISATRTSPRGGSVVFIARGARTGELFEYGGRTEEIVRIVEDECTLAGVELTTVSYDYPRGKIRSTPGAARAFGAPGKPSAALGFLLWSTGIFRPESRPGESDNITSLLAQLAIHCKPVSVLDDHGRPVPALPSRRNGGLFIIAPTVQGEAPGVAMGRYLMELGHRRIAFLSAIHGSEWSQSRLAGLRRAFAATNSIDAVTAFTLDEARTPSELDSDAGGVPILAMLSRLKRAIPMSPRDETAFRALQITEPHVEWGHEIAVLFEHMKPLMQQALECPGITAWVAANDFGALACLDFLANAGVSVPGDISVAGFDDRPPAFKRRLTTYDFNYKAVIHTAVMHILDPGNAVFRASSKARMVIDGYVVPRDTTGKVQLMGSSRR